MKEHFTILSKRDAKAKAAESWRQTSPLPHRASPVWLLALLSMASCAKKDREEHTTGGGGFVPPTWTEGKVTTSEASGSAGGDCAIAQFDDLFKILNECGIPNISDKKKKTLVRTIPYDYTRVINAGLSRAVVPLRGILNLDSDLLQSTLDVGVEVREGIQGHMNLDGVGFGEPVPLDPLSNPIKTRAEDLTAKFRGPVINTLAEVGANFHPKWRGIQCTILGAVRLVNKRGGYTTEVEFDAPYVPNVSPKAIKSRYEKELGDYKVFRNVKATVVKTDNPALKPGQSYLGNIVVEKVPAKREVPMDTNGQRLQFEKSGTPNAPLATILAQGDTAYRVTNHFGTDEETLALGFHLWTEYYIDHTQRDFSFVVANVGDDDLMYFKGEYKGKGTDAEDETPKVTYQKNIAPLLARHCANCHAGGMGGTYLGTYEEAKREVVKASITRTGPKPMPPGGPIPADDLALFKAWAEAGYPER